ncbi:hypothetical protein [Sulfurimonas sp.]|uniref:hypothetical protein n=1 Tax=Sulfurimonas sp. TaxID=2022749 RepID=UPI00260DCD74|nr:hypothetical protein [Sulfurimonas sp.]
MQTLAVQIEDGYIQNFMNYVNNHSENITVYKDKNLEDDSFFYERKKELQQIRAEIQSGRSKLMSFADFENKTNQFEKELELKYAN